MEKDKLISFVTSNKSLNNHPEVVEWINSDDQNKDEYIRYKNLWAIMQQGQDMPDYKIQDALSSIRKRANRKMISIKLQSFFKYAAVVLFALLGGYLIGTNDFHPKTAMNEVFVPNGNRTSVVLPDGTKVWLNNGTKLVYPNEFNGNDRIVELEGEGFFDVTPDKAHPFILKIGKNQIKVLGTKFAVVAYSMDKTVKTELISGKIQFDIQPESENRKLSSYVMSPTECLILDKKTGELSKSTISDKFYNYWVKGVYEFKDETFEELAIKIERIYNVKVIFRDETLKRQLFSGTLSVNDNIFTLMEVFKRASGEPFNYTHKGNEIYIGKKKN